MFCQVFDARLGNGEERYRSSPLPQNVIIQAIHVNYTSWYGKLSENYADSKK